MTFEVAESVPHMIVRRSQPVPASVSRAELRFVETLFKHYRGVASASSRRKRVHASSRHTTATTSQVPRNIPPVEGIVVEDALPAMERPNMYRGSSGRYDTLQSVVDRPRTCHASEDKA